MQTQTLITLKKLKLDFLHAGSEVEKTIHESTNLCGLQLVSRRALPTHVD